MTIQSMISHLFGYAARETLGSSYYETVQNEVVGPSDQLYFPRALNELSAFDRILVEKAKSCVCIVNSNLDERIYGQPAFIKTITDFLGSSSQTRLHILLERDVDLDQHPLVKVLYERDLMQQVQIRRVHDERQSRYCYNFMVTDGPGYRIQRPMGPDADAVNDYGTVEERFKLLQENMDSYGHFGSSNIAHNLFGFFNDLQRHAEPFQSTRPAAESRAVMAASPAA